MMQNISAYNLDLTIKSLINPDNHDIYEPRLTDQSDWPSYKKVPHRIYLYYIRFLPDGYPDVRQYIYDAPAEIPYDGVTDQINILATNARNDGSSPQQIPCDFSNLKWDRISYIAFVMDSPCWTLWKRTSDANRSGVVFNPKKAMPAGSQVTPTNNQSFFDAKDIMVSITKDDGSKDIRSGIYFIDHMKLDDSGNDGWPDPNKWQKYYAFELYFDVSGGGGVFPMTFVIDPGGTNMGPPTPPP